MRQALCFLNHLISCEIKREFVEVPCFGNALSGILLLGILHNCKKMLSGMAIRMSDP